MLSRSTRRTLRVDCEGGERENTGLVSREKFMVLTGLMIALVVSVALDNYRR